MELKSLYDAVDTARGKVNNLATQIVELQERGETEKANELIPQLDVLKSEAKQAEKMYFSVSDAFASGANPAAQFVPANGEPKKEVAKEMRASNEYVKAFFDAFKVGASPKTVKAGMHSGEKYGILMDALTETGGSPAGSEGGFLLPIDFDNMIREKMRSFVDLANYVNVEQVSAYSGWRAVETSAASSAFAAIVEADGLAATESPTFTKVEYTIVDYGGYLPVSNNLLADTPANIMAYLSNWMARKVVLTNNSLILALIDAISATAVSDYKTLLSKLKTTLNKTLDPAISAGAVIFTNQSGFDLMDQLDDGTGRPLLQPDPTSEIVKRALGRQVVVLSDTHWANLATPARARFAIGDGREYCTFFRRAGLEMAATTIGGGAWRGNNTEVRAIMRADVVAVDASAMATLAVTLPS
jgi:HK97 family phage major capsid protein